MSLNRYYPETGNHPNFYTTTAIYVDTSTWSIPYPGELKVSQTITEIKPTPKEGVEMKGLYDVYLIYAEDRADILLKRKEGIIASDDEDAKIKSGLMKDVQDSWDADYLTFIVRRIGDVKVKARAQEVKQVV